MKKNTLIKILCLALVCVIVLPMVVACGGGAPAKMWTVSLDPNGGTLPEGVEDEFEVADEEKIGNRLPTPTRLGFKFLGWYFDDDYNMRDPVDRRTEVDDDFFLVAQWEADGEVISIEFDVGATDAALDKTLLNGKTYIDMLANMKIGDFIAELPSATREGYEFMGWRIGSLTGEKAGATTVFKANARLYAEWYEIPICTGSGTTIHDWSAWRDGDPATCTKPAQRYQTCNDCGMNKYMDDAGRPALGHKYPNGGAYETVIINNKVNGSRKCTVCEVEELHEYEQITYRACTAEISGQWYYGTFSAGNTIDGVIVPCIATKNLGQCTVTVSVKNDATYNGKVYIDALMVSGQGTAAYEVYVTYADGTRDLLGNSAFSRANDTYGSLDIFDVGAEVRSVELVIPFPSDGSDKPCEIGFLLESK